MSQCICATGKGTQCSRTVDLGAKANHNFCWQHQDCKKSFSVKTLASSLPVKAQAPKLALPRKPPSSSSSIRSPPSVSSSNSPQRAPRANKVSPSYVQMINEGETDKYELLPASYIQEQLSHFDHHYENIKSPNISIDEIIHAISEMEFIHNKLLRGKDKSLQLKINEAIKELERRDPGLPNIFGKRVKIWFRDKITDEGFFPPEVETIEFEDNRTIEIPTMRHPRADGVRIFKNEKGETTTYDGKPLPGYTKAEWDEIKRISNLHKAERTSGYYFRNVNGGEDAEINESNERQFSPWFTPK